MSADAVISLSFHQKANSMLDVDGQALMSLPNAIKHVPDPDGRRTEMQCTKCGAHSGHEFVGEHLMVKNTREYVNSLSIRFILTSTHE